MNTVFKQNTSEILVKEIVVVSDRSWLFIGDDVAISVFQRLYPTCFPKKCNLRGSKCALQRIFKSRMVLFSDVNPHLS